MYSIFTYKTGWFLGPMLVNIPYMEHMVIIGEHHHNPCGFFHASEVVPLRASPSWRTSHADESANSGSATNCWSCSNHFQHMGLSENRVYSQWNSHLIGIMIINPKKTPKIGLDDFLRKDIVKLVWFFQMRPWTVLQQLDESDFLDAVESQRTQSSKAWWSLNSKTWAIVQRLRRTARDGILGSGVQSWSQALRFLDGFPKSSWLNRRNGDLSLSLYNYIYIYKYNIT